MLAVLRNRTYRHLFLAQVIALLGTGLATVALGLQAFELADGNAGAVLGTALAIKMIAYVVVAPIATAFTEQLPTARHAGFAGSRACCRRALSSVHHGRLAGLSPDLRAPGRLGRLHADIPGNHSRCSSG